MPEQNNRISWYRVPLERAVLASLTARSDAKGFVQTLGFLAVLGCTGTAAFLAAAAARAGAWPAWAAAILVFFHGTCWAFILQPHHEFVHNSVFKTRGLNTFFGYFVSFLGWFNPIAFKASHTRHHLYTLHPPRDREVRLPIRITLVDYLKIAIIDPIGLYSTIRGTIVLAFGKIESDWLREVIDEEGPDTRRRLVAWARFLLVGHALIITSAVVTGQWILALLISLARFYGRWLEFLCNETQHIGLMDNVDDFRLCCRTFTLNPVVRFLYWHMNYHTEHHMYAAVPCYNLHRLHRLVRHALPEQPEGIAAAWRVIAAIQRTQRDDPGYQFQAVLPDVTR